MAKEIYLHRIIEAKVEALARHFPIVLVNGARQVGKSTLLKHIFPHAQRFVFDPVQDIYHARLDPDLFLKNLTLPAIFDEIQYAPELLPSLKRFVDENKQPGQFLLTGSQNLAILKTVSESLAGRVAIVSLEGMTAYEQGDHIKGSNWLDIMFQDPDRFLKSSTNLRKSLYEYLWRGQFPGTLQMADSLIPSFYRSYQETYIERDIRLMADIKDMRDFSRFIALLAALTSQEVNYSELGRELGISHTTAKVWYDLLIHSFQWKEVQPFFNNEIKKLSKKGKGYMRDTGFVCALNRISSPIALAGHPSLGPLFETMGINLLSSLAEECSTPPNFYHWRAHTGAEVDLILEKDGILVPLEFKCKTTLISRDLSGLKAFRDTYENHHRIGKGFIMYAGDKCIAVDKNTIAIPWDVLLDDFSK